MVAIPQDKYPLQMTEAEYLTFERASELKHEFINGEVFAMSGASRAHNLIVINTLATLHTQLRQGDCEIYPSDMRVKIIASTRYTYPDITVVCGEPQFADNEFDTLLNPLLLIEVLSPSTEAYDRGDKFQHYRKIPSLRDTILISQATAQIDHYHLQDNGTWSLTDAEGLTATLTLEAIGCELKLADVYERVQFDTKEK